MATSSMWWKERGPVLSQVHAQSWLEHLEESEGSLGHGTRPEGCALGVLCTGVSGCSRSPLHRLLQAHLTAG